MTNPTTTDYKVDDILIEYGQAYQIDKIEISKDKKDNPHSIIHYRTMFANSNQQPVYCSIPSSALDESGTRKPISPKEARKILRLLKQSSDLVADDTTLEFETTLQENDITQTAAMVKYYHRLKHDPEEKFSATKSNQYEAGLKQMSEEFAVVLNSDPQTMRQKILSYLDKK